MCGIPKSSEYRLVLTFNAVKLFLKFLYCIRVSHGYCVLLDVSAEPVSEETYKR